jgi:hypothetical protein
MKQRRIEECFPRPKNGIDVEIDRASQQQVPSCAFAGALSEGAQNGSPDDEEVDDDELDGVGADALPGVGSDDDQGAGGFPGMTGVGDAGTSAAAGDVEPADQSFALYDAIQGLLDVAFATIASESSSFLWQHELRHIFSSALRKSWPVASGTRTDTGQGSASC